MIKTRKVNNFDEEAFLAKVSGIGWEESWKEINELLNKRSKFSNIDSLKESCSEIVHKKNISNSINNFFCSMGKDLADKLIQPQIPFLQVTMKLTSITQQSASRLLKYMKSGKHLPWLRQQRALGVTTSLATF